jgi:hypothetical protein
MMNHSTHVMRRPPRAWPPAARAAAGIIAAAALVLAAACSGSPSSTDPDGSRSSTGSAGSPNAGGSANSPLLAFSQCMRSRGVPDFPDPQPGATNAKFPSAQQLGVASSQYQAAENACQHLLPAGIGDQFPPAEVPLLLIGMREFSQCMRSHGVPNWPDPTVDSEGRPVFLLSAHGFTLHQAHSPRITHTVNECQHLLPSALGGMPTG